MDSVEKIYSTLMKDTLEMVCRMAGPSLAFHAVASAQEKFSEKLKGLVYTRYDMSIELKDSGKNEKAQLLSQIFQEIINYAREVIGDNIYIYAEKGIDGVRGDAEKEKVALPKIAS
ncbi:MAG: hypothetical protein V1820_06545 [archaeon]